MLDLNRFRNGHSATPYDRPSAEHLRGTSEHLRETSHRGTSYRFGGELRSGLERVNGSDELDRGREFSSNSTREASAVDEAVNSDIRRRMELLEKASCKNLKYNINKSPQVKNGETRFAGFGRSTVDGKNSSDEELPAFRLRPGTNIPNSHAASGVFAKEIITLDSSPGEDKVSPIPVMKLLNPEFRAMLGKTTKISPSKQFLPGGDSLASPHVVASLDLDLKDLRNNNGERLNGRGMRNNGVNGNVLGVSNGGNILNGRVSTGVNVTNQDKNINLNNMLSKTSNVSTKTSNTGFKTSTENLKTSTLIRTSPAKEVTNGDSAVTLRGQKVVNVNVIVNNRNLNHRKSVEILNDRNRGEDEMHRNRHEEIHKNNGDQLCRNTGIQDDDMSNLNARNGSNREDGIDTVLNRNTVKTAVVNVRNARNSPDEVRDKENRFSNAFSNNTSEDESSLSEERPVGQVTRIRNDLAKAAMEGCQNEKNKAVEKSNEIVSQADRKVTDQSDKKVATGTSHSEVVTTVGNVIKPKEVLVKQISRSSKETNQNAGLNSKEASPKRTFEFEDSKYLNIVVTKETPVAHSKESLSQEDFATNHSKEGNSVTATAEEDVCISTVPAANKATSHSKDTALSDEVDAVNGNLAAPTNTTVCQAFIQAEQAFATATKIETTAKVFDAIDGLTSNVPALTESSGDVQTPGTTSSDELADTAVEKNVPTTTDVSSKDESLVHSKIPIPTATTNLLDCEETIPVSIPNTETISKTVPSNIPNSNSSLAKTDSNAFKTETFAHAQDTTDRAVTMTTPVVSMETNRGKDANNASIETNNVSSVDLTTFAVSMTTEKSVSNTSSLKESPVSMATDKQVPAVKDGVYYKQLLTSERVILANYLATFEAILSEHQTKLAASKAANHCDSDENTNETSSNLTTNGSNLPSVDESNVCNNASIGDISNARSIESSANTVTTESSANTVSPLTQSSATTVSPLTQSNANTVSPLTPDVEGQILLTVGQCKLLLNKKFPFFEKNCDKSLRQASQGGVDAVEELQILNEDLTGLWDTICIQVGGLVFFISIVCQIVVQISEFFESI